MLAIRLREACCLACDSLVNRRGRKIGRSGAVRIATASPSASPSLKPGRKSSR